MLVLRPQPGAAETARKIETAGFEPVVAPLFVIRQLAWDAPDPRNLEAVLLTSANAPREAGAQLAAFTSLPCYAVGDATAEAARIAGFTDLRVGSGDGAATLALMVQDHVSSALHLCGRDHRPLVHDGLTIDRRIVYSSEPAGELPKEAKEGLGRGAVALLHSPRAATLFAQLVDAAGIGRSSIRLAAISPAAAAAAGTGWQASLSAAHPRDDALLELAAKLCKNGKMGMAE